MANEEKKIYVYENWSSATPHLMGILYANEKRGAEIYSFDTAKRICTVLLLC